MNADKTRREYKTNRCGEKTKLYKTKPTRQAADSAGPELYFRKNWRVGEPRTWWTAGLEPAPRGYKTNSGWQGRRRRWGRVVLDRVDPLERKLQFAIADRLAPKAKKKKVGQAVPPA